MNYRKQITDKIISDLEALKHDGSSTASLFANVAKIDIEYPSTFPAAILLLTVFLG